LLIFHYNSFHGIPHGQNFLERTTILPIMHSGKLYEIERLRRFQAGKIFDKTGRYAIMLPREE
jgi:hypothetical protein